MPKTKHINIEISENEYNEIKTFSENFGSSVSEFVLKALREHLEYLEDADYLRNRAENQPSVSWEEVQKEAGLI